MSSSDPIPSPYRVCDDFLQAAFIGCFLNGIFVITVCFTVYASVSKNGWNSLFQSVILSMLAMYILATIGLAIRWENVRLSFIDNGQSKDKIFVSLTTGGSPLLVGLGDMSFYVNMAIADGVLIWRCWVMWDRNWWIVLLPALFVIAELASGIVHTISDLSTITGLFGSFKSLPQTMELTNTAASLASTLLTTILIIFRILSTSGPKFGAVTGIVIESAAFYSISLIFLIGFTLSPRFSNVIPDTILSQVTGLAPTLMIARVVFGLARSNSSWSGQASALRFGSRAGSTNQTIQTSEGFNLNHTGSQGHVDKEKIGSEEVN